MPWSDYLKDKINDHIHGGSDYTRPGTTYFGRFTISPNGAGGGTEVGSRVAVTNNATNWPASSTQVKRNATLIDWGTAGSALGTIVAIAEFDASSGGNMLTYGQLTIPVTIAAGDPFSIAPDAAEFSYLDL